MAAKVIPSDDVAKVGLMYRMPMTQNFIQQRTMKKIYGQRQSYKASDTMVFDFTIGQDYIYGANSYLTFSLRAVGNDVNPNPLLATFDVGVPTSQAIDRVKIPSKAP